MSSRGAGVTASWGASIWNPQVHPLYSASLNSQYAKNTEELRPRGHDLVVSLGSCPRCPCRASGKTLRRKSAPDPPPRAPASPVGLVPFAEGSLSRIGSWESCGKFRSSRETYFAPGKTPMRHGILFCDVELIFATWRIILRHAILFCDTKGFLATGKVNTRRGKLICGMQDKLAAGNSILRRRRLLCDMEPSRGRWKIVLRRRRLICDVAGTLRRNPAPGEGFVLPEVRILPLAPGSFLAPCLPALRASTPPRPPPRAARCS